MEIKHKLVGAVNIIIEPGDQTAYQFIAFRTCDDYATIVGYKNFVGYDYRIDQVRDFFIRNPRDSDYETWKDQVESDYFFKYVMDHSSCDRHHALAALCCIKHFFISEE